MDTSFIYRYKGIIFDLDGTLTDSMPFHVRAWQQVAKEHGFEIKDEEIYRLGGSSSKDIAKFFKDRGENVGDIDEFVKRKIHVYTQNIDKVELFPKIADILVQAKKKGLKIAIGTGTRVPNATYILKLRGLYDYIDALVTADIVTCHKPHPETFLTAADKLGLKPCDCLVFEDGQLGVEAAKNGGFDCVLVDRDEIVEVIKA